MRGIHCQICPDKRKYQTKLSSIRNISSRLQTLIKTNQINTEITPLDNRELSKITIFSGVKVMCPNCSEISKQDVNRLEEELKKSVLFISKHNREFGNKNIEHQMLSLIRGYYPELVHFYQRMLRK